VKIIEKKWFNVLVTDNETDNTDLDSIKDQLWPPSIAQLNNRSSTINLFFPFVVIIAFLLHVACTVYNRVELSFWVISFLFTILFIHCLWLIFSLVLFPIPNWFLIVHYGLSASIDRYNSISAPYVVPLLWLDLSSQLSLRPSSTVEWVLLLRCGWSMLRQVSPELSR
jgi:hypothetical protein